MSNGVRLSDGTDTKRVRPSPRRRPIPSPCAENTLAVAVGLDVNLADRTTLTLGYSGEYATDAIDHGLAAKLRIQF